MVGLRFGIMGGILQRVIYWTRGCAAEFCVWGTASLIHAKASLAHPGPPRAIVNIHNGETNPHLVSARFS